MMSAAWTDLPSLAVTPLWCVSKLCYGLLTMQCAIIHACILGIDVWHALVPYPCSCRVLQHGFAIPEKSICCRSWWLLVLRIVVRRKSPSMKSFWEQK
jgi:hypothetical protein